MQLSQYPLMAALRELLSLSPVTTVYSFCLFFLPLLLSPFSFLFPSQLSPLATAAAAAAVHPIYNAAEHTQPTQHSFH